MPVPFLKDIPIVGDLASTAADQFLSNAVPGGGFIKDALGALGGTAQNSTGFGGPGLDSGKTVEEIEAEGQDAEDRESTVFGVGERAKFNRGARDYESTLSSFVINGRQTILDGSTDASLGYLENMSA